MKKFIQSSFYNFTVKNQCKSAYFFPNFVYKITYLSPKIKLIKFLCRLTFLSFIIQNFKNIWCFSKKLIISALKRTLKILLKLIFERFWYKLIRVFKAEREDIKHSNLDLKKNNFHIHFNQIIKR